MLLIKNCTVLAPESAGVQHILIAGGRIERIAKSLKKIPDIEMEIIDAKGCTAVPGLLDGHVHIAGAGGEGGPGTRTPEMNAIDILSAGVTTVIGMLGTDGITRSVESVLMKARSLAAHGLSAYILTGAYQIPTPTITGNLARDITLIPEVLGAGEIAVSDHRDSAPDWRELARLVKTVRVAGMLAGKTGVVNIHLGDAPDTFKIIVDAAEKGGIPWKHFLPTHCNRSPDVFNRAERFARRGGFVDITTSAYPYFPDEEVKPSSAVATLLARGVPQERICISSDAGGSLPAFDDQGRLLRMDVGRCHSLMDEIRDMVNQENIPLDTAIRCATLHPADLYGLDRKGRLQAGADGDLLILEKDLTIRHVVSGGTLLNL